MTGRVAAVAGVALLLLLACSARAGGYSSSTWDEGAGGGAQARRQQRTHGVPILVYFRADWCPHCRTLDEMLEEREVASRLREFIKVEIDPDDGDAEERLMSDDFGAQGFPALFLVTRDGSRRRLSHNSPERLLAQLPAK